MTILATATALAILGGLTASATAERTRSGNVEVYLDGGVSPNQLPRHQRAPVAVHLFGGVQTSDRSPLPRVNWIKLELSWRGVLDTRGMQVCPRRRLRGTDTSQAMQACGPARVGRGHLFAKVFVPNQHPFSVRAHLTAFNGLTQSGDHLVLVHAYASNPPVSFVIPFSVHIHPKTSRTVLVALIRRSAGPWPHVATFHMTVARNFRYRGRTHSYLSASCPAPADFTGGFSVARAIYTFAGGDQQTVESVRSCHAR
jgi:hypothetical protein